jgi:hypothetical protein
MCVKDLKNIDNCYKLLTVNKFYVYYKIFKTQALTHEHGKAKHL